MSIAPNRGRFVWHELMTTDTKAAMQFYTHVIGWKTEGWGGPESDYQMWVGGEGPLGGVVNLPEEARKAGVTPHWMCNVTVRDVDAAVERVKALGGRVLTGPDDMPEVGRFAVIADPQGATIALFKPASPSAPKDPYKPGAFGWAELSTSDHPAAFRFYHEIFGWEKLASFDMGEMGEYLLFGNEGTQYGGMCTVPKEQLPQPFWLYYTTVEDLDAAIARATASGGKLCNGPMPVPGDIRVAQLTDPQGAAFALMGK